MSEEERQSRREQRKRLRRRSRTEGMPKEQQATGSARLERTLAILKHAVPIVQRDGVAVSQTGKMFCAPPWRVTLQQKFGTTRIEIYRGRRLAAATWGDGDAGLHVEYLSAGTDWIADLLRELH